MIIKEVKKDLFTVSDDYALAHCINADFALGAGIAKEFDKRFNLRNRLFSLFPKSWVSRWDKTKEKYRGGCITVGVLLQDPAPYIFNLVTKRNYWDKPTLITIKNALVWLKEQCEIYNIKKIAMPQIGCGLDRQDWSDVEKLIKEIFKDTDIKILVCVK